MSPRPAPKANPRLRVDAEASARRRPADTDSSEVLSPEDTRRVNFELRVHQIELEMQNEELRRAQVELAEARARYFSLYDLAPVGYCTVSEGGAILEANLTAAALLGTTRSALVKRPLNRFIAPEDQDAHYLRHKALFAGGEPESSELRMLGPGGAPFWARLEASVVQDAQGRPMSLVVISSIAERKAQAEESAKLQAQLQQSQKMESLGILAGGIAHDMNNVLGAILALSSAHLELDPAEGPAHSAFATIAEAAVRGGRMVKRLLNFARQAPAVRQEVAINRVLRDVAGMLESALPARVRLELDLAPDLRAIRGDGGALTHAFMNLCVNALDAMPGLGTLVLRTRNLDGGEVEVRVEDTGCGMDPAVLARAMDPFFTTKGVGKGTGLGLSLVYTTVKAHGGHLRIDSEPGRGTVVEMRFPADAEAGPAAAAAGPRPARAARALAVLLVDDDDLVQRSFRTLLAALGHRPEVAGTGEAALALLEAGYAPDLVVLDMNMPGLGGAGTLPALRRLRPAVPVLLATGRADQEALDLARTFPGVTLLPKPFSAEDLQIRMEGLWRA